MKKKRIAIFILTLLSALLLAAGCGGSQTNYDGMVKVTFELEGGEFQTCKYPAVYYYAFEEGTENLIKDPAAENPDDRFARGVPERKNFVLEGWYRTKTVNDDESVTYSGKWDFAKDRVTSEGITLYANWVPEIRYTYVLCYRGDDGAEHTLGIYSVQAGEKFEDYLRHANKRDGYTLTGFTDEAGNPWNADFSHPGGEESLAIKVFATYTKGEFVDVDSADALKQALKDKKDINLTADIDFEGGEFGGFGDFKKILRGNGFSIKNFTLAYDATANALTFDPDVSDGNNLMFISLFGVMENAEVENVKFTGVTIDVNTSLSRINELYLAPLCINAQNSTVKNVTFEGTFTCSKLPGRLTADRFIVTDDRGYYVKSENSEFTDVTVSVDNQIAEDKYSKG